ncbi:aspartate/glutamate racemase family protein [Occultella aeris]|uniref:Asp/Glu/Hydantoin racemase n=1 Tax=Occultella aeris TaxID=2761496 RepID=A0A7M4DHY8_9MICO|nr:aspartate/glutamate racemase family protein [Occultella aeris]VZO36535.1 Asp/Glu/Hydantoin racemase [Occultella aeris]
MTRISFIHTGAVVIPTFTELAAAHLSGIEVHHLLDDKIVADLGRDAEGTGVRERLLDLGRAARSAGADAVVFSCSSISGYAAGLSAELGIPVLRIDEAMADAAIAAGSRIAVIATLATTLAPTAALLRERAGLAGARPELHEVIVAGAFEAVSGGDRARHDELVGAAIVEWAAQVDVVVLAQASMAGAAATVEGAVPVLTSPELGVRRVAEVLAGSGEH